MSGEDKLVSQFVVRQHKRQHTTAETKHEQLSELTCDKYFNLLKLSLKKYFCQAQQEEDIHFVRDTCRKAALLRKRAIVVAVVDTTYTRSNCKQQ